MNKTLVFGDLKSFPNFVAIILRKVYYKLNVLLKDMKQYLLTTY